MLLESNDTNLPVSVYPSVETFVVRKKTELAIDEDLLRRAREAASEVDVDLDVFIENGIRKQHIEHSARKAKRKAWRTDPDIQAVKRKVEGYRGNISLDRETIEAILQEDSPLDV